MRRHTRLGQAPLVPELRLYLASAVVPLWEACERRAGRSQAPPFWAFAWPGSQVLARWVLDHPEVVRERRVLDFAAGGGLAALAAVRAGAGEVLACDVDPLACASQRLNARANGIAVGEAAETRPDPTPRAGLDAAPRADAGSSRRAGLDAIPRADWDSTPLAEGGTGQSVPRQVPLELTCADLVGRGRAELGGADVVLAGDVCYDRQQSRRISAWLRRLAGEGALVLLADPGRAYAPSQDVELLASIEVPTLPDLESATHRQTRLLRLPPVTGRTT